MIFLGKLSYFDACFGLEKQDFQTYRPYFLKPCNRKPIYIFFWPHCFCIFVQKGIWTFQKWENGIRGVLKRENEIEGVYFLPSVGSYSKQDIFCFDLLNICMEKNKIDIEGNDIWLLPVMPSSHYIPTNNYRIQTFLWDY